MKVTHQLNLAWYLWCISMTYCRTKRKKLIGNCLLLVFLFRLHDLKYPYLHCISCFWLCFSWHLNQKWTLERNFIDDLNTPNDFLIWKLNTSETSDFSCLYSIIFKSETIYALVIYKVILFYIVWPTSTNSSGWRRHEWRGSSSLNGIWVGTK